MRNHLLQTFITIALLCLIGWLLVIGRSLIVPLIIALILWYIANSLSNLLRQAPKIGSFLPKPLTMILALLLMLYLLTLVFAMLSSNLQDLAGDAPEYQQRLDRLFASISTELQLKNPIALSDLVPNFSLTQAISTGAALITSLAGSGSLVFIYLLFMIMEAATFDKKLEALFESKEKFALALAIRREIAHRMRHYLGIKTAVSLATGLLTYLLLTVVGLPYAPLFGFIAYLLNYIPTIGSLISVVFPALLSLVYFENISNFMIISLGLGSIQFVLGNVIEPRLMGNSLNISPLVIMISLTLWGAIWGVLGMVLCIPLVVLAMIICAQFPTSRPIAILLSANGDVGEPIKLQS
ncbi:AI-2E family transporter [Polycladidibacter hongkongensis]|uniref:AI-2E family transporter n=1 Tax=Polycladidibacter hongkongensis TaxID=1647556 RepID=UPI00082FD31B|nr:AI-2E family transporter [Pseudovibrio hongkongensis]